MFPIRTIAGLLGVGRSRVAYDKTHTTEDVLQNGIQDQGETIAGIEEVCNIKKSPYRILKVRYRGLHPGLHPGLHL